jgi:AcrR family transcriptional regulator
VSAPESGKQQGGEPELPDELARLPHGRHGLPQEFVERNQRERLLLAFTEVVGEDGYGAATIEAITARAGVSSRTFYKYFETVEECYLAAFERGLELAGEPVAAAWAGEEEWPEAVRAALAALLGEFDADRDLGRLLSAEPFVAGPQIARRHREAIERLEPYLAQGRELSKEAEPLPPTTEKGLLGAANSLIGRHLFARAPGALVELAPDLTIFLLTPYLGKKPAAQVARRAGA